jgi:hypothetical protein
MSNYTSQELRTIADAVDAEAASKPVEQMHAEHTKGEWKPLGHFGIVVDREWRYRPAPAPEVIPWTRETLPPLPVEVIQRSTGDRFLIMTATKSDVYVLNLTWMAYSYLNKNFTRPDGSACGEVKA